VTKRVVVIVQARLGSDRLPRKVLADITGKPMIAHVIERASAIRGVTCVIGAVPTDDTDLIDVLRDLYVDTVMGSEDDVLSRFVLGATLHQADIVLRVTGDCPLLAPEAGDEVVDRISGEWPDLEYCSNDTLVSGWPDGTDVEGFTRGLLDRSQGVSLTAYDREHVTPWMRRNAARVSTVDWTADPRDTFAAGVASLKLSVDTADDLQQVRDIHGNLMDLGGSGSFSLPATVAAASLTQNGSLICAP